MQLADKITAEPWTVRLAGVEKLRGVDLLDEHVFDVIMVVCWANCMDGTANALALNAAVDLALLKGLQKEGASDAAGYL